MGLRSPDGRFDSLFLSNYAVINVVNELERLPGVGDVSVLGAGQYAMRVWLDPNLLQARSLTPADVIGVIQQQSQEVAAGQIGAPPAVKGQDFQYTLNLNGRINDAPDFENIVVKVEPGAGGRITRIRDVGHVELGAPDLQRVLQSRRPSRRGHRHLAPARSQRELRHHVAIHAHLPAQDQLLGVPPRSNPRTRDNFL